VLDLHSNEITAIQGLDGLQDLRVLNLAGNCIRTVHNISMLSSLTELNLRRNNIDQVLELDRIPSLQRVFLSHNHIALERNIMCLYSLKLLIELSLDANPIADESPDDYRLLIIGRIPR
jgi:Leucine-rich repeat (LRR) protein